MPLWMHESFRILILDEIQDIQKTHCFLGENLSQLQWYQEMVSQRCAPKYAES